MPKLVDHEQRREDLAAAVWRLASQEGLEGVTMRAVAAEAGWSTGAVNHYFSDKEELVLFAFRTVADRVSRRLARVSEEAAGPLELLPRLLEEGLPLDAERRAEVRVWFAFLGLALTRPVLARAQRLTYRAWRGEIAKTIRAAQAQGEIAAGVDPDAEAAGLVALVDGLAVQATFEPRTVSAERQRALLHERLDALASRR